jgi:hypothetical protein
MEKDVAGEPRPSLRNAGPRSSSLGEPVVGPDARLKPATRLPKEGTNAGRLCTAVSAEPVPYQTIWMRAGFSMDPYGRDGLRRLAKAGFIRRTLDASRTELFSRA